ncbi:MAG: sigma 54-interacting transcriptional regulator [Myxococcales bacterium]|nr:sigma 54-interacting transcriptional regulator [Myxococcales bacterium]
MGGERPFEALECAGEGARSRVYRGVWRATGAPIALKVSTSNDGGAELAAEGALLARLDLRWGPRALGAGACAGEVGADAKAELEGPGARWLALGWSDGHTLSEALRGAPDVASRVTLAARVAHGVGRALEELHALGLRHGDVKPANILVTSGPIARDAAEERGVSLVDYGFAGGARLVGATPRYLAPEVSRGGAPLVEADLFALGVVLLEVLEPDARGGAPLGALGALDALTSPSARPAEAEVAGWARALTCAEPAGRPSARWVADRAARLLGLLPDPVELRGRRMRAIVRGVVAPRASALGAGTTLDPTIGEPVRGWLLEASARLASVGVAGSHVAPLSALEKTRWLLGLVGPQAAAWPSPVEDEAALARSLLALAERWELGAISSRELSRAEEARVHEREREPATEPLDLERVAWLARECAAAEPAPEARAELEARVEGEADACPLALRVGFGRVLLRRGELGRAHATLAPHYEPLVEACEGSRPPRSAADACLLGAEIARRRGDRTEARRLARAAARCVSLGERAGAVLGRLAWDEGDLAGAVAEVEGAAGGSSAEVLGLVRYSRGEYAAGCVEVRRALAAERDAVLSARLAGVLGMLEHARGDAAASLAAFARASELAGREGALVEEASYGTGVAAAAADLGDVATALATAQRVALLWERFGQPARAARAWLSRSSAFALVGASHGAREAATEALVLAGRAGDPLAEAYARWALAELSAPVETYEGLRRVDEALAALAPRDPLRVRAAAALLRASPDALASERLVACDAAAATAEATARWEWWGARALHAATVSASVPRAHAPDEVLAELLALASSEARGEAAASEGRALEAGVSLAERLGHGDAAKLLTARLARLASRVRAHCPPELLAAMPLGHWARARSTEVPGAELAPAQIEQLEGIVKGLASREGLRPLLDQVLDALVLWTGVERGLLLLCAPNGRLVPRAARNLARGDLVGEQLSLSMGLAKRALESGEAVVALDALTSHGDAHASVHALRLRSVLAVPLRARGDVLGVVYLDDRLKTGAFGPRELAWVRLLATQAAMAVADARDKLLLRRAVRREARAAERATRSLGRAEAELVAARATLAASSPLSGLGLIGTSEPLVAMLRVAARVAASDVPVLVLGESGTGKELVARAIHARGARKERLFVGENCASVPEALLESTLFGHVKGAFTGASATRVGLFELAHKGTLFLDEIGEMSPGMQAKLLRVLQDGEVRPVGSERSRRVDVRVIGATHRDLAAMVRSGAFREDLYYRLDVVTLRVPPLRERRADIPLLFAHFLEKHAGTAAPMITRAALAKLTDYAWPGNVRQLENEARRSIVLADGRVDVAELSPEIAASIHAGDLGAQSLRQRLDALEAELVREALEASGGNQTRAATALGVSRFGLQKMMKRLSIR